MKTCRALQNRLTIAAIAVGGIFVAATQASAQSVIWDNGSQITQPNGGCPSDPNPHNDSELQNVAPVNANVLGFGLNNTANRVADDFTLLGGTTVSSLTVYGYQTGSTTTSTFTAMFVRIWNGRPGDVGSTIIFGDTTTNRLSNTSFSGIYRSTVAGAAGIDLCNRPLMQCTANFSPAISLSAGTYWVEWGLLGSLTSGPFAPPVTVTGAWYAGNARQVAVATNAWVNLVDNGNNQQGDMPFVLKGNACALPVSCFCAADIAPLNAPNGVVNVDDLLAVINTWGQNGGPQGPRPQGDVAPLPNGNCLVNVDDLLAVINAWGPCPAAFGACCLDDGSCTANQTVAQCAALAGTYKGNCTTCAGVTCPIRPVNNKCSNAIVVTNGTTSWDNSFATTDGPAGTPGNGCEEFIDRDIWFNYTATCTGAIVVDTVGSTGNTDTVIAVYDTWNCPRGGVLGCNDDIAPTNGLSSVTVPVTAGQQVKIRVGSFVGGPEGTGKLNIACKNNDICPAATALAIGGTINGSLTDATQDTVADCNGVAAGFGKWYTVVGNGHTLTADTCTPPAGGSQIWNGRLSVYCGSGCSDLTCVNAADVNSCNFFQETVSWCSAAGQTYWILVHTDSDPSQLPQSDFVLHISDGASCNDAVTCGCLICPPGSIAEGEPCAGTGFVDTTNGGCNSTPPVFGAISANGPAICGIGSTYINGAGGESRDTDWYVFTVGGAAAFRVQGNANFTAIFGIVTNTALNITTCGAGQAFVAGSTVTTNGDACSDSVTSAAVTLQPGTYAVFAGPSVFTGFPCTPDNHNNKYWVRLLSP